MSKSCGFSHFFYAKKLVFTGTFVRQFFKNFHSYFLFLQILFEPMPPCFLTLLKIFVLKKIIHVVFFERGPGNNGHNRPAYRVSFDRLFFECEQKLIELASSQESPSCYQLHTPCTNTDILLILIIQILNIAFTIPSVLAFGPFRQRDHLV